MPTDRPAPSEAACRFAALPKMHGRSGGDRPAPPAPLPAPAPSAAAARFAALPKLHGWVHLTPLDDRARRLAEGHLEMARAAARRLRRLGDDAESEAVWQVVRLAARWAGDEAGFAVEVARRLANVHRRAWAARSVVAAAKGLPAPRVRSLTAPDGRTMDVADDREIPEIEEVKGPMLFAVTYKQNNGNVHYLGSTGELVADPALARKHSTIADAECWRLGHLPDFTRSRTAVVKVCDGNSYDRNSVVLDRTNAIDANGQPPTNGAAGRHAPDHRPRNHCREWLADRKSPGILLPRSGFNTLARAGRFVEGPFRDTFGDGVSDPYIPDRQAFGRLDDGRCVYCELTPP